MESKKKILLIINPISGGSEKDDLKKKIEKSLSKRDHKLKVFETTGTSDKEKIETILDGEKYQLMLVAGGDGTIQLAAKAVADRDIAVGLIPAGSANGLASNLNIPDDLEDQIEIALGNKFIMMDILSINDHYSLHIADLGINAALIENYENSSIRGKWGYMLQTIPTLIESNLPYGFSLDLNGEKIEKEGVMVAIANAKQFATGAVINPDGKMDDGLFEVLIFKSLDVVGILKTLNENSKRDPEFVESFTTTKVTISCDKNVPFQVDGEFIGHVKKVSADVLPAKLKLMVSETFQE